MGEIVRTKTPTGDEIVILPAEVYDRLVEHIEDARDAAIAGRAMADYRSGKLVTLTSEEMKEVLAAPSPVGFWRRKRGLTQTALAAAAKITQPYLAQVEAGRRTPAVAVYRALAIALDIGIERLME